MSDVIFDVETDGLLLTVSKVHCISAHDSSVCIPIHYSPEGLKAGLQHIGNADKIIGHNICSFDIPAVKKVYPSWVLKGAMEDTLLLSCMLYPDDGILSLEDWAKRLSLETRGSEGALSLQKVQHEDWSTYTPEMKTRCDTDVEINRHVWEKLKKHPQYPLMIRRFNGLPLSPLELEQQVALIHAQQVQTGVRFNVAGAVALAQQLDGEIDKLRHSIVQLAPRKIFLDGIAKGKQEEVKKGRTKAVQRGELVPCIMPFKKDGSYTQNTLKYFGTSVEKVKGPYTKIEVKELNPDSDDEVKELLLSLGWQPTEWNSVKDKVTGEFRVTSPKLTEDSYDTLPDGLGKMVAEFNTLSHRRSSLLNKDGTKGSIIAFKERGDGRVSAEAFTCGTNTSRYRHQGTVCNIPRPTSRYGREIRSLFYVNDSSWQVGVDLSGIEARMLCHYLLRGNYKKARETADLILSGDFHDVNAKMWGVSRDKAKSGLYCLMYGGGAKKLARTLGKPEKEGAKLKDAFFKEHPGIKQLMDDLEKAYKARGYLIGLDGRPLYIRANNKLLNTVLQNAAAIVFKYWMLACYEVKAKNSWNYISQTIAYHDELQFESFNEYKNSAEAWGKVCEEKALEVGKLLGILVPIEAKAKIGRDWAQCH